MSKNFVAFTSSNETIPGVPPESTFIASYSLNTSHQNNYLSSIPIEVFDSLFPDKDYEKVLSDIHPDFPIVHAKDIASLDVLSHTYKYISRLISESSINHSYFSEYGLDDISYDYIDFSKISFPFNIRLTIQKVYSTSSFLDTFNTSSNQSFTSSDPYPANIRYFDSGNGYIVMERPPFKINLNCKPSNASSNAKPLPQYEIWMPWTVVMFYKNNLNNAKIFFSDRPIQSMDHQMIACTMPNTYAHGDICFSNSLHNLNLSTNSYSDIFIAIVNEYFSGGWNMDLGLTITQHFAHSTPPDRSTYPLLYEYTRPTIYSLSKRFPNEKTSHLKSMINNCYDYSPNRYSKYFFKMLSSFTLSETLSFYSQIISYNSSKSSNSNIILEKLLKSSDGYTNSISYSVADRLRSSQLINSYAHEYSWNIPIIPFYPGSYHDYSKMTVKEFSQLSYELSYNVHLRESKEQSFIEIVSDYLSRSCPSNFGYFLDVSTSKFESFQLDNDSDLKNFLNTFTFRSLFRKNEVHQNAATV